VFWIVTKPDDEQWQDSLGRSINYGRQPIATLHRGRYGSWAASMKATHWRYEFTPPALVGSPAAPPTRKYEWFAERQHPEQRGRSQVMPFATEAEAQAQAEAWNTEDTKHGAHYWQRPQPEPAAPLVTPEGAQEDIKAKYYELLYAVAQKFPGESRHQTALRYIRQREEGTGSDQTAKSALVGSPAAPEKEQP
jgi:hypothetical protein